ncbi:MAG: WhiB family transcriptional regulator [Acidimicrobiales bacterium]|nr:WhiB family transcriptional regulator [Acidimicrobiales bacterium]RZV45132.1 MAG: WhiB family transcriptional regulator [Acidimicrobiales bacterium]
MDQLIAVHEQMDWPGTPLCNGKSELFFPPVGERRTRREKREALARSYCNQCQCLLACRNWARTNREHGFWGGENEEQRAAIGYPPLSPARRSVAEIGRKAQRENELAS